jgi:hypothetical protein
VESAHTTPRQAASNLGNAILDGGSRLREIGQVRADEYASMDAVALASAVRAGALTPLLEDATGWTKRHPPIWAAAPGKPP